MGKDWTIGHEEGDETYFNYFRAMQNTCPKDLLKVLTELIREEERNDVYIYKTIRYPPKSIPPEEN